MSNKEGRPTEADYKTVAEIAGNNDGDLIAIGTLAGLLERETNHSDACNTGLWYWQLGLLRLAKMMYEHSIKIKPEAPTYFNLAVCCDDLGLEEEAICALCSYYNVVSDDKEKAKMEKLLAKNNKKHLIDKAKQRKRT